MPQVYNDRWEVVRELGKGGQGQVWLVRDMQLYTTRPIIPSFTQALQALGPVVVPDAKRKQAFGTIRQSIVDIVKSESPSHQGALKVLHQPDDARDHERASERIRREIRAMSGASHPNLLSIHDFNLEEEWFVSQFHSNGTLHNKLDLFKGNLPAALAAFRPLVAAVAELHTNDSVHRDIKPANVFLSAKDELILGDFGLVYFTDDEHTRLSGTLENVGTRDWMPSWALGQRIEEVLPSFDVFCLGKLLWAMVSGQPFLPLWYFHDEEFNVEGMFPRSPYIESANPIFSQCIVEREAACLPDAGALLKEVDRLLRIIDLRADAVFGDIERPCRVCSIGNYRLQVDRKPMGMRNFGIDPVGTHTLKIFTCSHCGHVELFSFYEGDTPPAWPEG